MNNIEKYASEIDESSDQLSCFVCNKIRNGQKCEHHCPKASEIYDWLNAEVKEQIEITSFELELLKHLKKSGFYFIARDCNDYLYGYESKPYKGQRSFQPEDDENIDLSLFDDLFQFIKWEYKEPCSIDDLIERAKVIDHE